LNEVQSFVFEDLDIRGAVVRLEETWLQVLAQHYYPEPLRRLLGEGVAATVLLATGLKEQPRISLQLQGDGPVKLLLIQCSSELKVRGMAQWREADESEPLLGSGRLAVNLEAQQRGLSFQGIVPLVAEALDECLEAYFKQSEQLPTRLFLKTADQRVAGLLLQALPAGDRSGGVFDTVSALARTASAAELNELPAASLLTRLFPAYKLRLFMPRPVAHDCRCTAEHLAGIVRMLGAVEVEAILRDTGSVELTCEFCNRSFRYDDEAVRAILDGGAPAQRLH
jgi:molecular chaperone Hsp33